MCAIAGLVYSARDRVPDSAVLESMRDAMTLRGPDDRGTWIAPGIGLASRRLSIVDLSERGHMPMATEDGRYVIVHNGEVYNYRELRKDLTGRGHRFQSDTDTEVLLRLYAEAGPAMLDRLNGMFAFAIWDAAKQTLLLARDRMGQKPLYVARSDGGVAFASEVSALRPVEWVKWDLFEDSLEDALAGREDSDRYDRPLMETLEGLGRLFRYGV